MGHLHGRRVLVSVQRNHFYAVTLQFQGNLFAQFSRAAQQGLLGYLGKRSSDFYHSSFQLQIYKKRPRRHLRSR